MTIGTILKYVALAPFIIAKQAFYIVRDWLKNR